MSNQKKPPRKAVVYTLGFVTMLLFKPRSWCVYCPMGTMTQLICKVRSGSSQHT